MQIARKISPYSQKIIFNFTFYILHFFTFLCLIIFTSYPIEAATNKIIGYDDFGREIVLDRPPERIVMLSTTHIDTLFALGRGDRIVGVCDSIIRSKAPPYKSSYPELIKKYPILLKKETVGDSSNPNIEKIISLNPDLVIIHDSSDTPGKYSRIFEERKIPFVAFTTPKNIEFGLSQIKRFGILLGKGKEAERLIHRLKKEINRLPEMNAKQKIKPLVWWYWGSGLGTYGRRAVIDELITKAGGINLAHKFDKGYFELSAEYIIASSPDIIIIPCYQEDQYKTKIKEIKENPLFANVGAVKNNRIYGIDGHSFHCPIKYPEVIKKMGRLFKQ